MTYVRQSLDEGIEISLSFVISDNYSQHLAVVLASVLKNAGPNETFVFHILASYISEENQTRLRQFEQGDPRCRIVFHQVDKTAFEKFPLPMGYISIETYFRYLIPEIITNEQRTIYLDVDLLVKGSLRPIWETNLGGHVLGAVVDAGMFFPEEQAHCQTIGMKKQSKYFNAGVMLMDLVALRTMRFAERCMENTQRYANVIKYQDQDIINLTLEHQILELPSRFNTTSIRYFSKNPNVTIVHFIMRQHKPWYNYYKNNTWKPYFKYLLQTPYRDKAISFLWNRLKGFVYFRQRKLKVERILICGICIKRRTISEDLPKRE